MFFRKKKVTLELIKRVDVAHDGTKTTYLIRCNGRYVSKSCFLAGEESKANAMFDKLVESGGKSRVEEVLRKKTI